MKFAILTDIHLGPEEFYKGVLRKINKDANLFLDRFVHEMNDKENPEFVIVLGDLIQDENSTKDKQNMEYIIKSLKKLKCSVHYVAGNHDLKNISETELAQLFNQEKLYYSFDSGDFHFITLFSKAAADKSHHFVSDEQILWLNKDLENTNKKCILFVHIGMADQDLTGNPWFEGRPEKCLISNRKEIRNILSSSNKIIAVFNSHLHWDRMDIHNNIPYFTIQSLVENENDKGVPSETHAIVNIDSNKIDIKIKGNYPKSFSHHLSKAL